MRAWDAWKYSSIDIGPSSTAVTANLGVPAYLVLSPSPSIRRYPITDPLVLIWT
jgi:hypothetical protein